ncbi:hypothetical protein [Methylophilus sp. 5]|uniref:hypothetical protein n=1 Tax=Methylophilus sp. 5 TaxID=1112274 RepID=UPI00048A973B|nr:hypothetical protein [Methylophilus sp. 5]
MPQLSLKMPFMVSMLFFLGLVSRDLNTHHALLLMSHQAAPGKMARLHLADILYTEPTLKIRKLK